MSRFRLLSAVVATSLTFVASVLGCPVAKRDFSSIFVEPSTFAELPAQKCDDCPIPDLMVIDFDAGTLPPSDHGITEEQVDFLDLYFAAGGFFNEAFNNDPRHDCMRYFDNHFEPNAKTVREMLPSQPIPPPTGAIEGVDYVVGGKITGSRGHYNMSVSLEDATTREQITSASVQFADPGDALAAGEQAERAMAPLFDKISDYQKKKRDQSDDIAIHAIVKITPSRQKMNVGEQQSVDVFAHDCDGEDHPLKNRKIKLRSDNGTFSPAEVTTGSDGKVKATFTAQKKGLADLNATYYPYTTVTHKQAGAHNDATIQIGDPPSGVWEATIDVVQTDANSAVKRDTDSSVDNKQKIVRDAHVTIWIQTETDDGKVYGTQILAISGDATFDFMSSYNEAKFGDCPGRGTGRIIGHGSLKSADAVIQITIDAEKANINGTIPIVGSSDDSSWWHAACQTPGSGHQHQVLNDAGYGVEFGYGSDQLDAPQTAQTKQSRTFKFSLDHHDRQADAANGSVNTYDRTGTITLRPLTMSQTPAGLRRH
ncbi:MAG TPA: Ig-like domain-containing protein [Pyrinomonadaceae bacterium]|jgi:hypothetical protein